MSAIRTSAGGPPTREPARPRSRNGLRLQVDWTACEGRGLCAELLPELLVQDQWGYPMAAEQMGGEGEREVAVPRSLAGPARRAVAACPRLALHLRGE